MVSAKRYIQGATVAVLIIGSGLALYYLPRSPVELYTSTSSTGGFAATSSSSASPPTSTSSASQSVACTVKPSTSAGNITFVLTPSISVLGPGLSETLNLTVLATRGTIGNYSVSGYYQNFLGYENLGVRVFPTCVDLLTGRAQVNVTVSARSQPVFGKDYFDIIMTGVGGYRAQGYPVYIAPHVVQLLHGGFNPSSLNLQSGAEVEFFNLDDQGNAHRLSICTAGCASPASSPVIPPFRTWNYTFSSSGTFDVTDEGIPGESCMVTVQ